MTMSTMTVDQILRAVEQLSPEEQATLIQHLQEQTRRRMLPVRDKMALLRAAQLHVRVNQEPSVRRVDWYDDDGR